MRIRKIFKVKLPYVPNLGYLDKKSNALGEKILRNPCQSTWQISLQMLKKGDMLEMIDSVWVPQKGELHVRLVTKEGVLVAIPYSEMFEHLEELTDGEEGQ